MRDYRSLRWPFFFYCYRLQERYLNISTSTKQLLDEVDFMHNPNRGLSYLPKLRQIHVTQTGGLIIHNILCELNSIIVLYIFQRICLKKTLLSAFAKVWENYTEKGPENLVYFELDMINAVSTADILLIECSLPIRLIILIPMWNITVIVQLKSLKRIMWNAMKKVLLIHCIWWIDLRHLNPKHTTVKPLLNNTVLTLSRLHLFSNSLYCLP